MTANKYEKPQWVPVSDEALAAYRAEFRAIGPRHRNVDRWEQDLGWRIEPEVVDAYLALDYQ